MNNEIIKFPADHKITTLPAGLVVKGTLTLPEPKNGTWKLRKS